MASGGLFLFINKCEGKSGAYGVQLNFLNSLLSFNYFIWNVSIKLSLYEQISYNSII